ncbi:MarR family transcriptional regulator [Terribacillus saccharophilus]|uniref:MarR family winged helix-turn-helix transcriptional regulator n=1 Tax=Terribacillus saccharophilus TaxID=361277 RepID=UPI0039824277
MSKLKEAIDLFNEVSFMATEIFHKKGSAYDVFEQISPQQVSLIKILSLSGACSPGHLAMVQQVHKSAISNRLKKLLEKDLVKWVESDGDKRTKLVQITDDGEAVLQQAEEAIYDRFCGLFEHIKEEDVETFIRIFTDVKEQLKKGEKEI